MQSLTEYLQESTVSEGLFGLGSKKRDYEYLGWDKSREAADILGYFMYNNHGDIKDKHDVTNWTKKYTEEFQKILYNVINDVIVYNRLDSHKPVTIIVAKKYKDIFDKEFGYICKSKMVKKVKYLDTVTKDDVGEIAAKEKTEYYNANELLPRKNGFSVYWNQRGDKEFSFFVKFQKK